MTNNINTDASNAANVAETARVALADSLNRAKTAGLAVLTKAYGPDADTASITLAVKVAKVLAGGDKPRGGAAQRINDTIRAVEGAPITPAALASAARTVLDAHKEAEAARRKEVSDKRQAAKAVLNDGGVPLSERRAAFELMTEIDAEVQDTKTRALMERVTSALIAARNGGLSVEQVQSVLLDVFPVLDERPAALKVA